MISPVNKVTLYIDDDYCQVCPSCLAREVCKVKAVIIIDKGEPPFIDMHRCYGCMLCMMECPFDAVKTST